MLVGQGGFLCWHHRTIVPKIGLARPEGPEALRAEQVQGPDYHLSSWPTFLLAWACKTHPWVRFSLGSRHFLPSGPATLRAGKITFLAGTQGLYQSDEAPHVPMGHMVLGPWYRWKNKTNPQGKLPYVQGA